MLLGGILTDALDWHWIFLVNLPIGIAVVVLSLRAAARRPRRREHGRGSTSAGAVTVTAALMLAVYAIVNGNEAGWTSGADARAARPSPSLLLALFVVDRVARRRAADAARPLPLRNVATANVVGVLWAAAMFAWFFLSALYLQLVLGYSPLQVGLAFLPATSIMAALSLGLSAKLVMRFGIRVPLGVGLAARGVGLAPVRPRAGRRLLRRRRAAGMILLGFGAGMAFNPVLLAAMGDVAPEEAGLASGVVNTAFMMGGALGLAMLASLAASRTDSLAASGSASSRRCRRLPRGVSRRRDLRGGRRRDRRRGCCARCRCAGGSKGDDAPGSAGRRDRALRLVLLVERADRIAVDADPDARVERLEQLDRALPVDELGELGDRDRCRTEVRRVALAREDCDLRVGRQEVREEAVTLLDAVVVVRDGLAGLDDSVLGRGPVRRHSAREPRGVECISYPLPVRVPSGRGRRCAGRTPCSQRSQSESSVK